MAHNWWNPLPHDVPGEVGTEEWFNRQGTFPGSLGTIPGNPDMPAAMEWARNKAEQEGREPNWKDILSYWTTDDPSATPAGAAQLYRERQLGEDILPEYGPEMEEEVFAPPVTPGVAAAIKGPVKEVKETDDIYSQLFLASLMEEMGGGKVGQAPGVVTGGGFGGLPSMMGQFRRQQKPWWIV